MALSRPAWIAAGVVARLLMIGVLAMAVQSRFANRTRYDFKAVGYNTDLQSYTYAVVASVVGMAGSVLQIPVAVYLLCRGKRMTSSSLILDVSMYADIVSALDRVDILLSLGRKYFWLIYCEKKHR
jgi:hypothetical protein